MCMSLCISEKIRYLRFALKSSKPLHPQRKRNGRKEICSIVNLHDHSFYSYLLTCDDDFMDIWWLVLVTKSRPTLATPWTVACRAPLSMEFSSQKYWSGLPFPFPGDLPDRGIEPESPTLQADSLLSELPGKLSYQGSPYKSYIC